MDLNKVRPGPKDSQSRTNEPKSNKVPADRETKSSENRYKDEEAERWLLFGAWVRSRRRSLGISQNIAASRAGIAGNHWSRIENGRSGIRHDKVEAIACALELHPLLVFEASGYSPPASLHGSGGLAVRPYRLARRSGKASGTGALVVAGPDASNHFQAILDLREDVSKLEGYMVQILDNQVHILNNQRRQEEFAHSLTVVLRGISNLMEGRPAAVLKRLLNQRGSRSGTALRTY